VISEHGGVHPRFQERFVGISLIGSLKGKRIYSSELVGQDNEAEE
jgi:hypothetical protein